MKGLDYQIRSRFDLSLVIYHPTGAWQPLSPPDELRRWGLLDISDSFSSPLRIHSSSGQHSKCQAEGEARQFFIPRDKLSQHSPSTARTTMVSLMQLRSTLAQIPRRGLACDRCQSQDYGGSPPQIRGSVRLPCAPFHRTE